jgi:hypothetical protein
MNDKAIHFIGIVACIIMLVSVMASSMYLCFKYVDKKQFACGYCHNTISENSDVVIFTSGERVHAECYLKCKEDTNGKTNSKAP